MNFGRVPKGSRPTKKSSFFKKKPKQKSLFRSRPKGKPKPNRWGKPKPKLTKSEIQAKNYKTKYNVYRVNEQGVSKKVKTFGDKQEADSWVANEKAVNTGADFKTVADIKKKGLL